MSIWEYERREKMAASKGDAVKTAEPGRKRRFIPWLAAVLFALVVAAPIVVEIVVQW